MTKTEFAHARKILGKTQREMAQLLGTSVKAISSYEQGWRSIPLYIEKQIYFFLSRLISSTEALEPCWDVKGCAKDMKEKCPAWEFNIGRLCWFISGTFCAKCVTDDPRQKINMCRKCKAFKPIARLLKDC